MQISRQPALARAVPFITQIWLLSALLPE